MIIKEKDISRVKIHQYLGDAHTVSIKNFKVVGRPGLYLRSFVAKKDPLVGLAENAKSNFEHREKGLLLHTNYSNTRTLVALPKSEIRSIQLLRGKEDISPFIFSPMGILLKLGVSVLYARYFRLYSSEYNIEPMELKLETSAYLMTFSASGFLFERHLKYFKGLNYDAILTVKK